MILPKPVVDYFYISCLDWYVRGNTEPNKIGRVYTYQLMHELGLFQDGDLDVFSAKVILDEIEENARLSVLN